MQLYKTFNNISTSCLSLQSLKAIIVLPSICLSAIIDVIHDNHAVMYSDAFFIL